MRRIDRVLVREEEAGTRARLAGAEPGAGARARVAGYGFVSALAGLSDHVPVVATIHTQLPH